MTRQSEWSPTFAERAEVLTWLGAGEKAGDTLREKEEAGITFAELANQWWTGVQDGHIAKRRGKHGYSQTTLDGYDRSLRRSLIPEHGMHPAAELDSAYWQAWVDRLARRGLSRSRIANHLAVVRAIYGWASRPTRGLVPTNPTLGIELPPGDERPRDRVATAEEAEQLLKALAPDDQVPFSLAFYAGLRRSDMSRPWEDIELQWRHVDLDALELTVPKSKSRAGTGRRVPIATPLRPILRRAWLRQGSPGREGRVLGEVSLHSGKLGTRVRKAWETESENRRQEGEPGLEPIGLHECRHTYASFLMAAHYTLRELMEYMGHSSLQATERYVKLLPQPGERNAADRLNAYLASTH